ncbi:DNA-protecting protein DprA [Pusillimonas sp. TS35]|uniref:DNA-processing protein DprA n=1 Tax=Paracandidimonas lactea TaxID=2895524 RepID=UPI00136D45C7|nr:DNA-processing protein DprA [Paracandidimonas lactea]MYN13006.1 DNA-protecting protein DprA [Pusillimonas sp. TS35]
MPSSLSQTELSAWLRLSMEPGLSSADARRLLAVFGLPQEIYGASMGALARVVPAELVAQMRGEPPELAARSIERALVWADEPGHHVLTLADAAYPPALLDTHDPPVLLYVNGDASLLSRPSIAVVGARSATPGGLDNARAFARHLAGQGWCVVSGLAQGVDAAAHEGALEACPSGGSTVAVLGTGIDIVYPAANRALAHRIAAAGALVSEFPMGMRALKYNFPLRNRVVAGLSRGVLVVEAARQSGSLITARLASEFGREVFAIPGSIHSPLSRGCHALIRQGARLVESGQDILEELGMPRQARPLTSSTLRGAQDGQADMFAASGAAREVAPASAAPAAPRRNAGVGETAVVGAAALGGASLAASSDAGKVLVALAYDPVHIDVLAARSGLDVSTVNVALLDLELSGAVVRLGSGLFQRTA